MMMAPWGVQHIIDRLSHYITFLTKYPQVHSENSTSKATNKDHCDHLKLLLCEVLTNANNSTVLAARERRKVSYVVSLCLTKLNEFSRSNILRLKLCKEKGLLR